MNKYIKYIFLILAAAMLAGCLKDSFADDARSGEGFVEVELGLEIADEGLEHTLTRAGLTWDQEYEIETLDLLVFELDESAAGRGRFRYSTHGYDIKNPGGSRHKTYKAMLATEYYDTGGVKISLIDKRIFIVVIANSRDVWNAVKGSVTSNDTFTDIMARLVFDASENWDTASPRYLPMASHGGANFELMTADIKGSQFSANKLLRSVAAIDIGFYYEGGDIPTAFPNFIPREVYLCNSNNCGLLSEQTKVATTEMYKVRIPSTASLIKRKYGFSSTAGSFNEIYIPESESVDFTSENRPYLMIMGEFDGEEGWYKVEFPEDRYPNRATSVYRNYRYVFRIEEIKGPGYGSWEEAVAGEAKDPRMWMNVTVVPWNERTMMPEIDGNYRFDVAQTEFYFEDPYSSQSFTLDLRTDYPAGWRVDDITYEVDPGSNFWLRTDVIKGAPFVQGHLVITVDQNNYTDDGRIGYIHLSAGRWKYKIKVQQGQVVDLNVTPASRTISFWSHRNGPTPQNTFEVNSRIDWSYKVTHTSGGDWGLEVHKTADGNGFYVQCDRNDGNAPRSADVTITSGGYSRVVRITQDWAECGIGGKTALADFGGTQVKTHLYGGNPRELFKHQQEILSGTPYEEWSDTHKEILLKYPEGEHYACWMVENSSYGYPDASYYYGDTSREGPYYSAGKAAGACPDGWRLPGYNELYGMAALSLVLKYNNRYIGDDELAAYNAWISNDNTLTGLYMASAWMSWGQDGYIYSDWDGLHPDGLDVGIPNGLRTNIDTSTPTGFDINIITGFTFIKYWTVRCVKEVAYKYE